MLRDSLGRFVHAFVVHVGHCPVVVAKLCNALYALDVAWSMGINHLTLELDSSSAISLIQ